MFNFYHTDKWSARKYFVAHDGKRGVFIHEAKLLHDVKTHPVMSLAKTNLDFNLNSGDSIEGLGAIMISRGARGNGDILYDITL